MNFRVWTMGGHDGPVYFGIKVYIHIYMSSVGVRARQSGNRSSPKLARIRLLTLESDLSCPS